MYNLMYIGAETYFIFEHGLAKANLEKGENDEKNRCTVGRC